ncbi:MAG: hypothetical protein JKY62_12165 [Desulfocapsa sp.]|nr:hypothetical protein [Desulfocapsa sp.]
MTKNIVSLLGIFFFSACHPHVETNICPISTDRVLSCVASSAHLSTEEITSKFESLINSTNSEPNATKLNKLLCLSLHNRATREQLQGGENILVENLKKPECKQKNLSGLLLIIQGNIDQQKECLDKNWTLYLKNKKTLQTQETVKQQLEYETISYQRRIEDLEQQVRKLKEIESMLDNKTSQ